MEFPIILRKLRKANNMTMKELGVKLSLAESTVSGYENGFRKPDIDVLIEMAKFFDVSVDYLLGIEKSSQVVIDDWLLEIYFANENKKRAMYKIWNDIKEL